MERTVPTTGSEEIRLYMRTYYSLLRTTDEVQIQTLVETHLGMDSLLHAKAGDDVLDVPAFIYTSLRLPACIRHTRLVVMGQSERVFARRGYPNVEQWQPVTATARRRRSFFDGEETLAIGFGNSGLVPATAVHVIVSLPPPMKDSPPFG